MIVLKEGIEGIPFDLDEAMSVVYGERTEENFSTFLSSKDMVGVSDTDRLLTEVRDGIDYSSFGETRDIEF